MKPAKDAHEKEIRAALYESEDFELLERILGEKRIPQQAELF